MQSSKPLHEAMREGGLSLGIFGGPGELLGVYREAGFNHIIVDQMFGVMSASEAIDAISRVRAAGLAPIVRVHTYPWSGEASGDMGAAAEVAAARMQASSTSWSPHWLANSSTRRALRSALCAPSRPSCAASKAA